MVNTAIVHRQQPGKAVRLMYIKYISELRFFRQFIGALNAKVKPRKLSACPAVTLATHSCKILRI